MKITTRVEYGIAALADIAIHSADGGKVSTPEISQRQQISQKYLEQILMLLRQGGFVRAVKGQHGGYSLAKSADKIRISDVLDILDNSILADATEIEADTGIRPSVKSCLWDRMNACLRCFAEHLTLSDFLNLQQEEAASGDFYSI